MRMKKHPQYFISKGLYRSSRVGTTIRIDLGDIWSHYCTLNQDGSSLSRRSIKTSLTQGLPSPHAYLHLPDSKEIAILARHRWEMKKWTGRVPLTEFLAVRGGLQCFRGRNTNERVVGKINHSPINFQAPVFSLDEMIERSLSCHLRIAGADCPHQGLMFITKLWIVVHHNNEVGVTH